MQAVEKAVIALRTLDARMAQMGTAEELKQAHEKITAHLQKIESTFAALKQGPAGPQGKAGADGQVDFEKLVREALARIPRPKDGKDGKDALVDHDKIARRAARLVPAPQSGKDADPAVVADHVLGMFKDGKVKIQPEHIEGLEQTLEAIRTIRRHEGIRGGGDTVAAGTGVTLTRLPSGQVQISATGSGAFSIIAVSGTIDDSNKSFTAASAPTLLNINGAFYQKTGGAYTWTYSGGAITLNNPVGTGGSIFGI